MWMLRINGSGLHYIWLLRKFIHWLHIVDWFLIELSSWSSLGMSGIVAWKMPHTLLRFPKSIVINLLVQWYTCTSLRGLMIMTCIMVLHIYYTWYTFPCIRLWCYINILFVGHLTASNWFIINNTIILCIWGNYAWANSKGKPLMHN